MSLSIEDVKKMALLARVHFREDEILQHAQTLDGILNYVDRLAQIDTTGVPEVETVGEQHLLRLDEPRSLEDQRVHDAIIKNFPTHVGDALSVPAVFENPKG